MEVELLIKEGNFVDDVEKTDEFIRNIYKRFPEALWEKYGSGYKIFI